MEEQPAPPYIERPGRIMLNAVPVASFGVSAIHGAFSALLLLLVAALVQTHLRAPFDNGSLKPGAGLQHRYGTCLCDSLKRVTS
jgi:hypothetical protein